MSSFKYKTKSGCLVRLVEGDALEVLRKMKSNLVTAIVTDPPYGIRMMNKHWDYSVPSVELWQEALRVLKPGGHLLSFAGSRTYHRMAVNIEDAGFEIRDQIMYLYGSGFPKSMNISKAIDKAAGKIRKVVGTKLGQPGYSLKENDTDDHNRKAYGKFTDAQKECDITAPATLEAEKWDGWGTALKPAHEPIVVARKPLSEKTIAANVLKHGTGAINIDECRVEVSYADASVYGDSVGAPKYNVSKGRFPANVIHDGSDEVVGNFPVTKSGAMKREVEAYDGESNTGFLRGKSGPSNQHGDKGSAARFFYCAKASKSERTANKQIENKHPTVKPISLMQYLCMLVKSPEKTIILDPFMGSGSTGIAAVRVGCHFIGIEQDSESMKVAIERIKLQGEPME